VSIEKSVGQASSLSAANRQAGSLSYGLKCASYLSSDPKSIELLRLEPNCRRKLIRLKSGHHARREPQQQVGILGIVIGRTNRVSRSNPNEIDMFKWEIVLDIHDLR